MNAQILVRKHKNPDDDMNTLGQEIDQQVYAIYGSPRRIRPLADLTPEEIKIVEDATP